MRRWCSRLCPTPPKHLKDSKGKKIILTLLARLLMDKFEADSLYPFHLISCFMCYFFIPLNATANLIASQYHTHLDRQIMFSFLCATFPCLLLQPSMRKTGYLSSCFVVEHLPQHFLGSHPTFWPSDSFP